MTVRKGPGLTYKSNKNTYYIELRNTYSLLSELSANQSQPDTPTRTDSQFIIRSAKRLRKKKNDKLKKYLYTNGNNDDEIIDTAVTLK